MYVYFRNHATVPDSRCNWWGLVTFCTTSCTFWRWWWALAMVTTDLTAFYFRFCFTFYDHYSYYHHYPHHAHYFPHFFLVYFLLLLLFYVYEWITYDAMVSIYSHENEMNKFFQLNFSQSSTVNSSKFQSTFLFKNTY